MMTEKLSADEVNRDELRAFAERLQVVDEEPRKLLAQVVELAYSEAKPDRESDTAYVPEILESSGLDVDHMYELFRALQQARLIHLESQYPFEKVRLEAGSLLRQLRERSQALDVSLRDVLVEGRFQKLGLGV